jgi:hypothetical protein
MKKTMVRRTPDLADADRAFRDDFVRLSTGLGLTRDVATQLVEIFCGRRFEACSPADLRPVLEHLLVLGHQLAGVGPGPSC